MAVFTEIYRGRKQVKTISELQEATRLPRQRVIDLARGLANNEIALKTSRDGELAYAKIEFFAHHRDKILRAAGNKSVQDSIPTKRNSASRISRVTISGPGRVSRTMVDARHITVDDIDSFSKVRGFDEYPSEYTRIPEARFKAGIAEILGERDDFKDWGGESRDLSSTKVRVDGRRRMAAFAFKGPGKSGKLVPGKMGKNGDQIQRLFRCPADVFIVQYWRNVDDSVYEQMQNFAQTKSFIENRPIWYGVIDGDDSNILMLAYPRQFAGVKIQ